MISTKNSFRSSDSGKNMDKLFGSDSFKTVVSHLSIIVFSSLKELLNFHSSFYYLSLSSPIEFWISLGCDFGWAQIKIIPT